MGRMPMLRLSILGHPREHHRPRFLDHLLLRGDEGIEHGDLLRVLALLVFAEEEEVGLVLRAITKFHPNRLL